MDFIHHHNKLEKEKKELTTERTLKKNRIKNIENIILKISYNITKEPW